MTHVTNQHDLVWVSRHPPCPNTVSRSNATPSTAPSSRIQSKPKPNPEHISRRQIACPSSSENVVSSSVDISGPALGDLTFSQLCQQDKKKIGALIRKLINLKADYSQQTEHAKNEKLRFDQELKIIQEHNQKIKQQTKDLQAHFLSSLALLKIYKERVSRHKSEQAEKDKIIADLKKELEMCQRKLEKISDLNEDEESVDEPVRSGPIAAEEHDSTPAAAVDNEQSTKSLAEENQRLQRLLDIQNLNRMSRPASQESAMNEITSQVNDVKSERCPTSIPGTDNGRNLQFKPSDEEIVNDSAASEEDIEFDQDLVKELNSHYHYVDTLLYLHNDASLLQSLEKVNDHYPDLRYL